MLPRFAQDNLADRRSGDTEVPTDLALRCALCQANSDGTDVVGGQWVETPPCGPEGKPLPERGVGVN